MCVCVQVWESSCWKSWAVLWQDVWQAQALTASHEIRWNAKAGPSLFSCVSWSDHHGGGDQTHLLAEHDMGCLNLHCMNMNMLSWINHTCWKRSLGHCLRWRLANTIVRKNGFRFESHPASCKHKPVGFWNPCYNGSFFWEFWPLQKA